MPVDKAFHEEKPHMVSPLFVHIGKWQGHDASMFRGYGRCQRPLPFQTFMNIIHVCERPILAGVGKPDVQVGSNQLAI